MATPNVGILTNAGKNLIDQVNAGQTKIAFSKIVFSSMNNNQLTDDQIKALTTVAPQEIVVNNPKVTLDNNTGETRIRATGNNEALTDGVYVKTYAVYAKDDSGNEILYGITVSPNPNYLPEYDGVTPQAVTYSYKVNISNTSNITFTNSNDIYVSDTDLNEAIQPYAKTVDVNQQLDKKVNTADTTNWQKQKVTTDTGDYLSRLTVANNDDLNVFLGALTSGFVTFCVQGGVTNNPSPVSARGIIQKDGPKLGAGLLIDNLKNTWSIVYDGTSDNPIYQKLASDGTVVHTADTSDWQQQALFSKGGYKLDATGVAKMNFFDLLTNKYNTPGVRIIRDDNYNSDPKYVGIIDAVVICEGNNWWYAYGVDYSPNPKFWHRKINGTTDTGWVMNADDSKVAHLSGANNFDTVPTVNNNPLLLASSLPSDLARTGQAQTFTAAQTFSIAPVINDASTDKGDTQAATMADLKSVENSAWHQLDEKKIQLGGTLLYKIDQSSKTIYMLYALNLGYSIDDDITIADFSSIVKNIKTISGQIYKYQSGSMSASIVDLSIGRPASIMSGKIGLYGDGHIGFTDGTYFTYDSLVNN